MQIPIIDNNYKMLCNELMWPPWLRSAYAGETNLGCRPPGWQEVCGSCAIIILIGTKYSIDICATALKIKPTLL